MSFNSFLTSHFHLVGIIWNVVSFTFFIVPTLLLASKLFLLRSHQSIYARRPRLVLVMLLSDIIYGPIILPLNWFYNSDVIHSKTFYHMEDWKRRLLYAFASGVYSISFYLFLLAISMRTWLVHFDIQFSNRHIKYKWTKFIETDASREEMNDDFYLKYRSTLGSYSFLQWFMYGLAILLTVYGVLSGIYTFSHPFVNTATLYIDLGIVCLVVIFNAIIYFQTRKSKFEDEFDIFFELRVILFFQIFACTLFGLFIMTTPMRGLPRRFAMNLILTTDLFLLTACVLIFPLYYATYNDKLSSYIMVRLGMKTDCIPLNSPRISRATSILSSLERTNKFMEHLMKEFSHENLLFVIECTQFKKYIARKSNVDILSVEMDDSIPQSSIVSSEVLSDAEKAKELYDKYIRVGAVLEVNLSYCCRASLIRMFEKEIDENDLEVLLTAFDDAMAEIKNLMGDSHVRYKRC